MIRPPPRPTLFPNPPPSGPAVVTASAATAGGQQQRQRGGDQGEGKAGVDRHRAAAAAGRLRWRRSEEHTSELQSHLNLVCRLLLENKTQHSGPRAANNLEAT